MDQTILVPLDGSTLSEQALPIAQTLAQRTSAAIHLVHVHTLNDAVYVEGLPVIDDQLHALGRSHEQVYLEQVRDRLATTAQISITTANPDTEVTVALILANYARDAACDLIIMATHGRSGFERFWLGSTTDALLRLTAVPLLLIRPQENALPTLPPAVQHIIIPLDGSHLAEAVLERAFWLGDVFGATYTLLQVIEPVVLPGRTTFIEPVDLDPDRTQERQKQADLYLAALARQLHREGRTIQTQTVVAISPATVILALAEQRPQTTIALATHGRHGLQRLLLGSVADKVIRGATTPVLVLRPQQPESAT